MERKHLFHDLLWGFVVINLTVTCFAQSPAQPYNPKKKALPKFIPASMQPDLQFGDLPLQLERSSQMAFNRGLMPLESRLKYLALARDARLSSAGDSEEAIQQVWGAYRNQIAEMVPRIKQLHQPGASGWNAELLLAQYSVLRADQKLASLTDNQSAFAETSTFLKQTSYQLYKQREVDYAHGLATLQDLMYAKDRLMNATDSQSVERIDAIETAMMTQQRWNSQGAEVGRDDRVLETKLTKELIQFQDSLSGNELPEISRKMSNLSNTGHQHFLTSLNYFRNGTAPLHQLTSSMIIRQRLQQLSSEYPELKNSDVDRQFQQDWSTLKSIAQSTSDRRGRNEADVLAIQLLGVSVESDQE